MKTLFTVIALSLAVAGSAQTVKKWQGASSEVWDFVTPNWLPVEGLPLPTVLAEGDHALFDDSRYEKEGAEKVVVGGTLNLGGVEVNNSEAFPYVFEPGVEVEAKLTGAGALVKEGAGELTTNVVNELLGGTIVREGMLTSPKVDDPNVFGPKVRLEGGTIQLSTSASGSTSYTMNSEIEIPEGSTGTVIAHRYSVFLNHLTGSGTLHFISRGERAFVRLDQEATNWKDFTGNVIVSGDTKFNPGYTGLGLQTGITWNAGDFEGKDSTFADNSISLMDGGALYSQSGERCYVIGELKGDETSIIHGYMKSSTTPGIYWMVGGLNTDVEFAGKILPVATTDILVGGETVAMPRRDNRVGLIKVGTGTYTFTNGENYITGGIDVVEGKVLISNPEGTRSGTGHSSSYETVVWVKEGAALGGSGRISGSVEVAGTLEPGDNGVGVLTVKDFDPSMMEDGKEPKAFTVFLEATSSLVLELGSIDASDKLVSDSIKVEGGVLDVRLATYYSLNVGDAIQLWDAALADNSVAFSEILLPMTDEGWVWDTSALMETGVITLTAGGGEFTSLRNPVAESAQLFPNPSNGRFTVSLATSENFTVEVFNASGQMVKRQEAFGHETTISLDGVQAGLYVVRLNTAEGVIVKKMVVQ
ncbi:T9SS type A sorting domain-containing protein [Geofilum rubicundum]|nr:T9SS type A sorting domain-containing protein [Geofilum rubicundum]